MEAVGAIKAHEVRAAEAIMPEKQDSLRKRDKVDETKSSEWADREASGQRGVAEEGQAKIERIAEAMDSFVKSIQRDLDIQFDKGTGRTVVRVLSRETGEVIREIPPKELLELASKMKEMAGVLLNKSA